MTAIKTAIDKYGRLDGLVINHAVLDPVERICEGSGDIGVELDGWRKGFEVNFFSAVGLVSIFASMCLSHPYHLLHPKTILVSFTNLLPSLLIASILNPTPPQNKRPGDIRLLRGSYNRICMKILTPSLPSSPPLSPTHILRLVHMLTNIELSKILQPAWGAYSAAKAALNSLCRTLATEEPEITAVAIRPGVVGTSVDFLIRHTFEIHSYKCNIEFIRFY